MTIENPFLADIISNREDDTPRLAYADWLLDVYGDRYSARAEFIKVQCELERIHNRDHTKEYIAIDDPRYLTLRQREGDLFDRHKCEWFGDRWAILWLDGQVPDGDYPYPDLTHAVVRRGFVQSITCSWAAFAGGPCEAVGPHHGSGRTPGLHEALYWHPKQTATCPRCRGGDHIVYCGECSGGGTVPRPCPPTAQPIKVVTLTDVLDDLPNQLDIRRILRAEDGHVFWRCDRWPTLDLQLQGNAV